APSYRFVGNLALAPLADRPPALRWLLAGHRNDRANLLGRVCRRLSRAWRICQPLADRPPASPLPPSLAPIPRRLRPYANFSRALAHSHPLDRMEDKASPLA